MIVTQTINAQQVFAECDAILEPAARDVLRTVAGFPSPPRDGLRIRFGWSLLTLRAEPRGLRVCEPLFSGDAEQDLHPTLDITLGVLVAQVNWLQRLREQGSDATFDQQIVLAEGALAATDIFTLRGTATAGVDSGWSIAPVPAAGGQIDMSGLRATPIYRLVADRPGLLPILSLPAGYLVRLTGNEVIEVDAPDGRVVWAAAGP